MMQCKFLSKSVTCLSSAFLEIHCISYGALKTLSNKYSPVKTYLFNARPTIDELPDAVLNNMTMKDKAFWVDKPGANAYTLHDAYYNYGMTTEKVIPPHQDAFPRSYQYDLDCVKYRRMHGCDGLDQPEGMKTKPCGPQCRDCRKLNVPGLTPFQLAWAQDAGQKRWKYYPDLSATLTDQEIKESMSKLGRPYQHEACNWYYKNYPPVKYDVIMRKFSK